MKTKKIFLLVVVSVIVVALLFASGCATDIKIMGPSLSWRSGAGKDTAGAIAMQPLGANTSSVGSSSAARISPIND